MKGLKQIAKAEPSTEHRKVTPGSDAVNSKVGVASPVVPLGPAVIVVTGGVVSTVK